MAAMLETPSRIWRRIEAIEDRDMPSLPSLPPFEDSADVGLESSDILSESDVEFNDMATAAHSTPAATSHAASTFRAPSSASSTARFARSIASRSAKSSTGPPSASVVGRAAMESFDASRIPSLPRIHVEAEDHSDDMDSDVEQESKRDVYVPPLGDRYEDDDLSISDALQSISRSSSPAYALSQRQLSPLDKFRNVSLRRPASRTRTPSLTHTLTSTSSCSTNDTPHSSRSIPASRSNVASPIPGASIPLPPSRASSESPAIVIHRPREDVSVLEDEQRSLSQSMQMQSMDITDIHISPPQLNNAGNTYQAEYTETETEDEQNQVTEETDDNHQRELESHESRTTDLVSGDEREPTFSSDAEQTPYAGGYRNESTFTQAVRNSPAPVSSAHSSPAFSLAFTPTPAFPRPRSRFNLPQPPRDIVASYPEAQQTHYQPTELANGQFSEEHDSNDAEEETDAQVHHRHVRIAEEDPMTPHTRRKSFLLSVINSTARPRLKYPTPHPRNVMATPGTVESTPGPNLVATPATQLRVAFAGVTPRPRLPFASSSGSGGRTSSESASITSQGSPNTEPSDSGPHKLANGKIQWGTPGTMGTTSPVLPTENVSFISTASSHDLTAHQRVNTSFDPAMGFGAGAQGYGIGRFNAGKLNTYLHGLNRRLQEENEVLMEKLRKIQEKDPSGNGTNQEHLSAAFPAGGRRSSAGRRVSGGTVLDDVREAVVEEKWLEEKAELEDLIDSYKEEIARFTDEREGLERKMETEKKERERDRQRWKERMAEVEQGVETIIKDLEQRLEQSEGRTRQAEEERDQRVKDLMRQLSQAENEQAMALERARKAEYALESEKELGGELRESNEKLISVMGELRNAHYQIQELEVEIGQADAKIDNFEKELQDQKHGVKGLEQDLDDKVRELAREKEETRGLENVARHAEEEVNAMKAFVSELEEQMGAAADRIANLEDEVMISKQEMQKALVAEEKAHQQTARLEIDAQNAQEMAKQMEDALEEAESKMTHDQGAVAELQLKINSLERELEREKGRDPSRDLMGPTEADIQALEEELDAANKEIARLNTLMTQSPARKAVEKAKDMRIEVLEREKEELLERNRALRLTVTEMNTPSKVINTSNISPIHRHVLSMSIRAPRTPGGPLKELSWLNSTSDPSFSPLLAEITRLQRELDRANESIDDKLDKLEDAGLGVVGLTRKLEDARAKIVALEDEIARLTRKEDRLVHRMERIRCHKCHVNVDVHAMIYADESSLETFHDGLPVEPETPPTRTSEALRVELRTVNAQLETLKKQWEIEKRQLVGEKAALKDATDRLNAQVKNAQEEARRAFESGRAGEKARAGVEGELETAKRVIADLEERLKGERANLRALTTEQDRLQREKDDVLSQLQRTESDMDDVRQQLYKIKQENHGLEKELRANATAEQKARILEGRVTENFGTIDLLRQERSLLAADHKQLQRRFTELTEQANRLRSEYAATSTSHDKRRHQLDLYRLEIDDLRRAVSEQASELQRAEKEKNRISAEKEGVAKTVASLEADLRRVKRDAEAFGRDLKRLRGEKENMEESHKHELARLERSKKQAQTQIRLLTEQLESQKDVALRAQEELRNHTCAVDDGQLSAMKLQHNKESKGLIVQIRYLKAKFTRESTMRSNLCYQKQYLLLLLARYEKSEKTIFASIACIGFPVSPPPVIRKPRKLRSVAVAVLFSLRASRAGVAWREQCSAKTAVATALQEVRQRRVANRTQSPS
ncbi:hypothetical protein AX17_001738 [Amanita inopinata Kibby_2008]|nr:hypothetical protein AX17_001738 [Amanita inopinata Kibby_2008]